MHVVCRGALLAVAVEQIVQPLRVESKEFVEFRRLESAARLTFSRAWRRRRCAVRAAQDKALQQAGSVLYTFLWLVNVLV